MSTQYNRPPLSVNRMDVERLIGFPAGKHTQPGPILPVVLAALFSVGFYASMIPLESLWPRLTESMQERGWVPYAIVGMSLWALMLVLIKWLKIRVQYKPLYFKIIPDEPDFVISKHNVQGLLDRLHEIADEPRSFILYNRVEFALSNLKNFGRISDLDDVLRGRAQSDEAAAESSYTIIRGLVWGIPVLGFIGTVIGLSAAIGSFGAVLQNSTEMDGIKSSLVDVTGGLATAFETTLQALIAALFIQLLVTFMRRTEEAMFDRFNEYCERQIISRLRLIDDPGGESNA